MWHRVNQGLELRLRALSERIAILQERTKNEEGFTRIEELGEIEQLKQRYAVFERRLEALNRGEPGLWHNIKAQFVQVAYDLRSNLGDFMIRLDHIYAVFNPSTRQH